MSQNEEKSPSAKMNTASMVTIRETLAALPANNAREFLAGVKEVANDLDNKGSAILAEIAFAEECLPEKLNTLQLHKKELLFLREEVVSLRDAYLSNAKTVLDSLIKNSPSILQKMEEISQKQARLRKLECEGEWERLLSVCRTSISERNLPSLEKAFMESVSQSEKLNEFETTSNEGQRSSLIIICNEMKRWLEEELNTVLASLKYPFEDCIDIRGFNTQVLRIVHVMVLLYRIAEYELPHSGRDVVHNLLFDPLRKRFVFHFYGDRKTNDISKPQWFLTQVLNWIQTTLPFFELVSNKIGSKLGISVAPTVFFHRTISQLALSKVEELLENDMVKEDAVLFSHLVDECIAFEEQRLELDPGEFGTSILNPFCSNEVLSYWLEIENDSCISRLDDMLCSDDAWQPRFREMNDADVYLVCECADSFVSLLHSLQLRARYLPDEIAQRRFVDLQLLLVDDFLKRLAQIARQAESPWSEPFPHVMNAIWYLCDVIEEWSESCIISGVLSSGGGRAVFDASSQMYRHVWSQMADDVVNSLRVQTIDLAHQYQQQRWCVMESRVSANREMSASFCAFLMKTRSAFSNAGTMMSKASVASLFKRMTSCVARVILEEVIEPTMFNAEGAAQMLYDVEKGLLPVLNNIFSRSGADHLHADYDNKMIVVLGSLRLLSMTWAVATLLREEIENVSDDVAEEKLLSVEINGISRQLADRLFQQRADLAKNANDAGMSVRYGK